MLSDTTQQVSGQNPDGDGITPNPRFSEGSGDSVPSDVDAIVAKAIERILPEVDKRIQSQKDKRLAEQGKRIEEVAKRLDSISLADLREMGVEIPKETETELRLRSLEQSATSPKAGVGAPSQEEAIESAKSILTEANISLSDPEVVKLWAEKTYPTTFDGYKSMLSDVARLVVKRSRTPSQTQAQATAQPQGVQVEADKVSEYTKEMLAARGNRTALNAIKEKYRKMGVPVDNIGFNV